MEQLLFFSGSHRFLIGCAKKFECQHGYVIELRRSPDKAVNCAPDMSDQVFRCRIAIQIQSSLCLSRPFSVVPRLKILPKLPSLTSRIAIPEKP